jgi:hypothetical protein
MKVNKQQWRCTEVDFVTIKIQSEKGLENRGGAIDEEVGMAGISCR